MAEIEEPEEVSVLLKVTGEVTACRERGIKVEEPGRVCRREIRTVSRGKVVHNDRVIRLKGMKLGDNTRVVDAAKTGGLSRIIRKPGQVTVIRDPVYGQDKISILVHTCPLLKK